jgi:hypothetical protein
VREHDRRLHAWQYRTLPRRPQHSQSGVMSIAILLTCLLAVCGTATCQEGPAATQQKQQQRLTWNRLGGLGAPLTDAATPGVPPEC